MLTSKCFCSCSHSCRYSDAYGRAGGCGLHAMFLPPSCRCALCPRLDLRRSCCCCRVESQARKGGRAHDRSRPGLQLAACISCPPPPHHLHHNHTLICLACAGARPAPCFLTLLHSNLRRLLPLQVRSVGTHCQKHSCINALLLWLAKLPATRHHVHARVPIQLATPLTLATPSVQRRASVATSASVGHPAVALALPTSQPSGCRV